jgi:hypothetical protein
MIKENPVVETPQRSVLVTGCGRSGSRYLAEVLTAAGLPCTHERVFTGREQDHRQLAARTAEASWYAVPWLSDVSDTTLVLHVVRHPLRCVGSWVGLRFFDRGQTERPLWKHVIKRALNLPASGQYRSIQVVRTHRPSVFAAATAAERGAAYWLQWNRWVEDECATHRDRYRRIRLEDVTSAAVVEFVREAGVDPAPNAAGAVREISRQTNTRGSRVDLQWSDLGVHEKAVRALAERYGYAV